MAGPRKSADEQFPIVEAFGYHVDASSRQASRAAETVRCRFSEAACEKFKQYGFGYCSVTYAAADDAGVRRTYAVCDHRLDGEPVNRAVLDHFGSMDHVTVVPEIVLATPRASFDYVAIKTENGEVTDVIAIETQAIDIRGGGVGPAWKAWSEGKKEKWREYFTAEAAKKNRKDTVAYGVNMANIYKRLGLQVAEKGAFLKRINVPFYVVMQDLPFRYLRRRIPFAASAPNEPWDITFMTFDYNGAVDKTGAVAFPLHQTVRTTLGNYTAALAEGSRPESVDREHFLARIKRKAGLVK